MSGLHVNDSGYMVMDSAFSIWFNNIRIPAGGVGNIGFQYIKNSENNLISSKDYNFHVIQYYSQTPNDSNGESGGGGGLECDGCTFEVGGEGGGEDPGCFDCVIIGGEGSTTPVTLVDIHGYPMHLLGGVHMRVHLEVNSSFAPIFKKTKKEKLTGSAAWRYKEQCSINPNPSSGEEVTLTLSSHLEKQASIYITDAAGKTILTKTNLTVLSGVNQYPLSTRDFAAGMYYVNIILNDKTSYNLKMVVVK